MLSLSRANDFMKVSRWRPGNEWVSHWPREPPIENGSAEALRVPDVYWKDVYPDRLLE